MKTNNSGYPDKTRQKVIEMSRKGYSNRAIRESLRDDNIVISDSTVYFWRDVDREVQKVLNKNMV